MTQRSIPAGSKAHPDGGTYRVIAFAETQNRWAIAITEWTTYRGAVRFEVSRVSPDNASVRLGTLNTEPEARAFGNQQWKLDRRS